MIYLQMGYQAISKTKAAGNIHNYSLRTGCTGTMQSGRAVGCSVLVQVSFRINELIKALQGAVEG